MDARKASEMLKNTQRRAPKIHAAAAVLTGVDLTLGAPGYSGWCGSFKPLVVLITKTDDNRSR
jgi:hypothetical protein